jgi:MoxR-like ATPase
MTQNFFSSISTPKLAAICALHKLTPVSNRRDHLIAALKQVQQENLKHSLDIVDSAAPAVAPVAAPASNAKLDSFINKLIDTKLAAVQSTIGSEVNAAIHKSDNVIQQTVATKLQPVTDNISTLQSAVGLMLKSNADREDALKELRSHRKAGVSKAEVTKAVADAFAPIKAAFESAPVEVQRRVAEAAPAQRKPIIDVFGVDIPGDCEVYGQPYNVDPDYVFDEKTLKLALFAIESGQNVWLGGERGTGKTQFALQLAARTGRAFFRVSFDRNTERAEFIGADGLVNGNTVWQDGQVLQAYRTPGSICLLDEASAVRPDYATTLHALLEPRSSYTITSTGETVHRAPGMAFIAADNTNGCGDSTGRYAGTTVQNSALIDRFAFSFKVKFLDEAIEQKLLVNRGATDKLAASLVNLLNVCRREVGAALVEPPSLRQAFAFVLAVNGGADAEFAWELSVVNKSPEESQEALRQLFTAHWA